MLVKPEKALCYSAGLKIGGEEKDDVRFTE
jgi:hypothetical protein